MRAMTYNIQHGEHYKHNEIDLSLMAQEIRKAGADFCGLNEIRGQGPHPDYTEQAEIIARELGWYSYFAPAITFPDGGPYGNAFVSRFPIKSAEKIMIPDPAVKDEDAYYETRDIIRAILETDEGDLTLLVTHMGLAQGEKRNAVTTVLKLVEEEKAAGHALILMGDFNMTPGDPILQPIFAALEDTTPLTGDDKSWPSDNPEIKIDYILSHRVKVTAARILPVESSDHRPVIADFSL